MHPDDDTEAGPHDSNSTRDEHIRYLSLFPTVLTGVSSLRLESIDEILEGYSSELLADIVAATENEQETIWMVHRSIGTGFPESTIREWLAFSPLLYTQSYLIAKKFIASLHEYQQVPSNTDLTAMGGKVMNECKALLKVTQTALEVDHEVFHDAPPYFIFKDERLTRLVMHHHDKADQISAVIAERQSTDADTIQAVLETEAAAVANGAL